MLELEEQGIERSLIDGQQVSADLLNAPGDSPAVLRSKDIECLEDHEGERSLQDVGLFFHGELPLRFPTGIDSATTPFGKQQESLLIFVGTIDPHEKPARCSEPLGGGSTFEYMSTLTLRLPEEMDEALERQSTALGISKSDLAREALKRYLRVVEFRALRSKLVAHAQANGIPTDEDVFAALEV